MKVFDTKARPLWWPVFAMLLCCLLAVRPAFGQTATAFHAPADIDPRWGVLAEMAEHELGQQGVIYAFRWKTRNSVLSWQYWYSREEFSESTLEMNPETGIIAIRAAAGPIRELKAGADGMLVRQDNQKKYLWRADDGTYRFFPNSGGLLAFAATDAQSLKPIEPGSGRARWLAELFANGRLAPGDPTGGGERAVQVAMQPQGPTALLPPQSLGRPARPATATALPRPSVGIAAEMQGSRIALVIGNSTYGTGFGTLANPGNDARLIAAGLRTVGFQVELLLDANQRTMKQAISRLGQRLTTAGRGSTGLFYYAGHGMQSRGVNFLIPVGAAITREADIDLEAVAADTVLRQMEDAGASTNIVILDACRNAPIASNFRGGSRGLARMDAPNGSFLSYSTAPGALAADGNGRNSPFAQALAAELQKPGQLIETTFRNVRRTVLEATGGQQTPWDASSLIDSFVFKE